MIIVQSNISAIHHNQETTDMTRIFGSTCWRRIESDRGVAFYYTAFISFFILAIVTVVFDVSAVSRKKIQAQNAADSAALEMAVWQCRGMNLVQNINVEIYQTDTVVAVLYGIAGAMTGIAKILEATLFLAPAGFAIESVAGGIARAGYWVHNIIVDIFLTKLRTVYATGTMVMGYLSANNAASANGAERIIPKIPIPGGGGGGILEKIWEFIAGAINKLTGGFVAIGIPTSPDAFYKLPIESQEAKTMPLNIKNPDGAGGKAYMVLLGLLNTNTNIIDLAAKIRWQDDPYRSKESKDTKIPPMIWGVWMKNDVSYISKYFLGGDDSNYMNPPVIAYAVGQAQGGNVTMTSAYDHPYRPIHYGVGADAFLISIDNIRFNQEIEKYGIKIKFNIREYFDKFLLH